MLFRSKRCGLASNGRKYSVRLYDSRFRIRRCTNCQRFDHRGTRCSSPPRCGYCANHHQTKYCPSPKRPHLCANCRQKHEAWHPTCPVVCRDAKRRIGSLRNSLPEYFHVSTPKRPLLEPGALSYPLPAQAPINPNDLPLLLRPRDLVATPRNVAEHPPVPKRNAHPSPFGRQDHQTAERMASKRATKVR